MADEEEDNCSKKSIKIVLVGSSTLTKAKAGSENPTSSPATCRTSSLCDPRRPSAWNSHKKRFRSITKSCCCRSGILRARNASGLWTKPTIKVRWEQWSSSICPNARLSRNWADGWNSWKKTFNKPQYLYSNLCFIIGRKQVGHSRTVSLSWVSPRFRKKTQHGLHPDQCGHGHQHQSCILADHKKDFGEIGADKILWEEDRQT